MKMEKVTQSQQAVPLWEKAGYSLGDCSVNLVFQIMLAFQLGFYTDVFGISATAAGTILLVARVIDAFVDPVVGVLADRTETKWGKYRPWILWTALPFAVFFFLAFYTPDWSEKWKVIYAGITYTLLMTIYSLNNTPYAALHGVMTSNIKERTSISSVRFVMAMFAALVVQGFTLPLVSKLGQGNDQLGWTLTIGLYAAVSFVFFLITFFSVKERITPPPAQTPNVRKDVSDIFSNGPWRAMFIVTLFIFTTLSLWGGGSFYFFRYYMDPEATFVFLEGLGLVKAVDAPAGAWTTLLDTVGLIAKPDRSNALDIGFSLFNMLGQLITIIGVLTLSAPLADRFGKRNVFVVCLSMTAVFTSLFLAVPPEGVALAFLINVLKSAFYAPTIPLLWAMMGDVADYSEYKHHRRATGFVFAGVVFALKAGLGLGGALCGWIVSLYGFVPQAVQTPDGILGIRLVTSVFPALTFGVSVIALGFYLITKKKNEEVQAELTARRAANRTGASKAEILTPKTAQS